MSAPLVVEHFDRVNSILAPAAAVEPVAKLALERGEERFLDGVVVAIAAGLIEHVMPWASRLRW
jgi:hypothetical protein